MIEPEYWGLPTTAWTAISAVGTLLAVAVALGLPVYQAWVRRRNLEAVVIRELASNRKILLAIAHPDADKDHALLRLITGQRFPKEEISAPGLQRVLFAWTRLLTLQTKAWERHRESLAELSFRRFKFYDEMNQYIELMRDRAGDFTDSPPSPQALDVLIVAVTKTLSSMDTAPRGANLRLAKWLEQ